MFGEIPYNTSGVQFPSLLWYINLTFLDYRFVSGGFSLNQPGHIPHPVHQQILWALPLKSIQNWPLLNSFSASILVLAIAISWLHHFSCFFIDQPTPTFWSPHSHREFMDTWIRSESSSVQIPPMAPTSLYKRQGEAGADRKAYKALQELDLQPLYDSSPSSWP